MKNLVRILDASEKYKCVGHTDINGFFSDVIRMTECYNRVLKNVMPVEYIVTVCGISRKEVEKFNEFLVESDLGKSNGDFGMLSRNYIIAVNGFSKNPFELNYH